MKAFVLVHQHLGIFLSFRGDAPIFSSDVGRVISQSEPVWATTFATAARARAATRQLRRTTNLQVVSVEADVDQRFASSDACENAGLGGWDSVTEATIPVVYH
jgi:hypothetical protein